MSTSLPDSNASWRLRRRRKSSAVFVRDPEQPSPRVANCAGGCERLHRLDQRILQHVLAVDHRADHARAIAMQFRPHLGEQAVNACGGDQWIWRRFHSTS